MKSDLKPLRKSTRSIDVEPSNTPQDISPQRRTLIVQISKYLVALVLLTACSDNPVEVEPVPATIEGSWRGSFVNRNYMRGATPRTDTFEIEFIQRSDNTVAGAGMWERWFDSEFDQRSYLVLEGVFVEPNLSVNGNSFWGLITLRGPLDGDVLRITKNGVDQFELYRQ